MTRGQTRWAKVPVHATSQSYREDPPATSARVCSECRNGSSSRDTRRSPRPSPHSQSLATWRMQLARLPADDPSPRSIHLDSPSHVTTSAKADGQIHSENPQCGDTPNERVCL